MTRLQLDRAPGQIALVALMVVAFAIVALSRFAAPVGRPVAVARPPRSSPSLPSVAPTRTPTPTLAPSSAPVRRRPSGERRRRPFRTTYTVKRATRSSVIAAKFETTAAAIQKLNGLKSPTLKVGQVLKIP